MRTSNSNEPVPLRNGHLAGHTAPMRYRYKNFSAILLVMITMSFGCGDTPHEPDLLEAKAIEQVRMTVLALEIYRLHMGQYPLTEHGLLLLREEPDGARGSWRGPYLPADMPDADPWGRALVYSRAEDGQTYSLHSLGADDNSPHDDLDARELMPRLHDEMAKVPPLHPTPIP